MGRDKTVCPLCGSKTFQRPYQSEHYEGPRHEIIECQNCTSYALPWQSRRLLERLNLSPDKKKKLFNELVEYVKNHPDREKRIPELDEDTIRRKIRRVLKSEQKI